MINPKISVIVPVYNTEKYLEKCIDSILNQTYQNLEIILVDDGSTDESGEIIDRYSTRDERIVVIHKENGGEGSARNAGLNVATGDYLGFVDSDDWIECGMYQTLVDAMGDELLDIVICNYSIDKEDEQKRAENRKAVSECVFDTQQLLRYVFQRDDYKGIAAYVWNKVFRRGIVFDKGKYLEFDNSLRIGTDMVWFLQMIFRCENVKYVDRPLYHYWQRDTSAFHTVDIDKRMDLIRAYQQVILHLEDDNVDQGTVIYVKRFLAYHAMNIAKIAYEQGCNGELLHMKRIMEQYKEEYVETNKEYPNRVKEFLTVLTLELQ